MKERIKEIYNKALEQHVSNNMAWEELNPEKFAELIIRECMDVVRDINQEYDGGSTVVNAAEEIKQHFGVEE